MMAKKRDTGAGERRSGGQWETLEVATWNVHSLVEDFGGDGRIWPTRPLSTSVDKKIYFLVLEMKRYILDICAVQETCWFETTSGRRVDTACCILVGYGCVPAASCRVFMDARHSFIFLQ